MIELPTPALPDLARMTGSTVEEAASYWINYFNMVSVPWSYRAGTRCVKDAYQGLHKLKQLSAGCEIEKNKIGREANKDFVQLAAPVAFGRSTQVFDLSRRQFPFGRGRRAAYRVPFFFVENRVVKLYFAQPRKHAGLSLDQFSFVATVHKHYLLDTEFFGLPVDVEYVDVSAPAKGEERKLHTFNLSSLDLWSDERLADRLTLISESLDAAASSGLIVPRKRHQRPVDPSMPLFD